MNPPRQINPKGPLCTPWELADIAIRLAALKGEEKPSREEALELLDWASSWAPTVRSKTTFTKGPLPEEEAIVSAKARVPFSDQITPPKSLPITIREVIKLASQDPNKDRWERWYRNFCGESFERFENRKPESHEELDSYMEHFCLPLDTTIDQLSAFWDLVWMFTPYIPRLQRLRKEFEESQPAPPS